MFIKKIMLKDYRNFESLTIELYEGVNIFYGDNAQGKTNFLESIYLGSKGRSQRTHIDKELIFFGKNDAQIQIFVQNENITDKVDIHIKKDKKKGIALNNVPIKKLVELYGTILTVIFSPEDLNLVKLGPSERRKFLDIEICQLSKIYYYNLGEYYKILKHRNSLLKSFKQNKNYNKEMLYIWDEQMVYHGCKIIQSRRDFINKLNVIAKKIHKDITNNVEDLEVIYKPNTIEKDFKDKLYKNIEKDLLFGITSTGIHKDDVNFNINKIDVKTYGSQGQQRTASLSTKLAQIQIIKESKDNTPILLLDDVLSELDESRQTYLLKQIKDVQTIITCTGVEDIIKKISKDCNIYKVKNGVISFEKSNFML
jgi:DNA replication and repair protein RecF